MSAVLITGCAGAGKSTIAAALARRGLACIDDDDDPFLARFIDAAGAVVAEEPVEPDFAWLSRHSWAWNPDRLDELIRGAAPATLYVCGGADNELELADRFTQVFLLEIDEPTMLARLDARQDDEGSCRGFSRVHTPPTARVSGPPARIRCDPHRRHTASRPGGGRDTVPPARQPRQTLEVAVLALVGWQPESAE